LGVLPDITRPDILLGLTARLDCTSVVSHVIL